MYLNKDIVTKWVIGLKGDYFEVISCSHRPIFIGKCNGQTLSVHIDDLSDTPVGKSDKKIAAIIPTRTTLNRPVKRVVKRKPSLFK